MGQTERKMSMINRARKTTHTARKRSTASLFGKVPIASMLAVTRATRELMVSRIGGIDCVWKLPITRFLLTDMSAPLVLAITGASGAVYAVRLLEVLVNVGQDVHLTISPSGAVVLKHELGIAVDLHDFQLSQLMLEAGASTSDSKLGLLREQAGISSGDSHVLAVGTGDHGTVDYFHYKDFMSPMASGSAKTAGMVICPCSGGTLSSIAHAASGNLIHRAADVHLKEQRKLVLVPRETPLSVLQLENMHRVAQAGAVVLPAMPGWYHGVTQVRDLVDFVVGRILDQLGIEHTMTKRWGESP